MRFHDNLYILIERDEKAQKTLNGKLPEFAAQHFRHVWLFDSEKTGSFDLFQAAPLHESVDFEDKLRLDQMLIGMWHAEIVEHVPATDFVSFVVHWPILFAICSASRSRRLIQLDIPAGRLSAGL
jgi:hypothetical protein